MVRRIALALAAGVLGLAGCSSGPENGGSGNGGSAADGSEPGTEVEVATELVAVVRQDVTESQKLEASVGFGTVISLPLEVEGIVTWAPDQRALLRSGDPIVEVSGRPVVLLVGDSPLYRPLRLVARGERDEAGTRLTALKGTDVAMLQRFLLAEGFDDKGRLTEDEQFGLSTHRAVKEWQLSVGHPATGVIDSSQMVFMTTELLMQSQLVVGQSFTEIEVTGTGTVLQAVASTATRDFFPVGSQVDVENNTGGSLTGTVTASTRISSDDGGARQLIEITIADVDPNELGQSVSIFGSAVRASDVLTVPVRALLATTDGGWQLEVPSGAGTERVAVELERVVGTTAIVTGIDEGTEVVVPL